MTLAELGRIGEIDRTERITHQYKASGAVLELIDVDIDAPRWGQPGANTTEHYVEVWTPLLEAGGTLIGAFDDGRLVGVAIYNPSLSEQVAQLAVLHVTRSHRRSGVGRLLTDEVVRMARSDGAKRLYVSATPTRGTVDFYMSRGFRPLDQPNERLFALEPDDIHMEMNL
jgi:GNAT superfamily N-acetyltransferase